MIRGKIYIILAGIVVLGLLIISQWRTAFESPEATRSKAPQADKLGLSNSRPRPLDVADTDRSVATSSRVTVALHFQDAEFEKLVLSTNLSDQYRAYSWLKECLNERYFVSANIQYPRLCGLSEGNIDNIPLRKRLVTDLAVNAAFGGVENLIDEGPNGRFRAFADDPANHAALVAKAYQIGIEKGEPSALASRAGELESQGDQSRSHGDQQGARACYIEGLTYAVASALGLAQQNGASQDATRDPNVQFALRQYRDRLTLEDLQEAINQGVMLARGWAKS